jgi:glycerate 2-kinase
MRDDAEAIWTAAMRAVQPERLVADRLSLVGAGRLLRDGQPLDPPLQLDEVDHIVVVGAGKAAAGMAAGIERLLGPDRLARHRVTGLVSVPAGCGRSLAAIEVRETRPAKANLPTPAVVQATREIMTAVSHLGPRDLVIAVITGGGSALLAAPKEGISLDEKIAVTRRLSESGADIATLNAARRQLSLVKGGGLARACAAGHLLVLVLSDVIGDDLDVIASGPCMPPEPLSPPGAWTTPGGCRVQHVIVGDNGTAVAAAAAAARQAGYTLVHSVDRVGPQEASAETVGARLVSDATELLSAARRDGQPRALIAGGEATVTVPADHGVGGRNQQSVLAAVDALQRTGAAWPGGLLIASVGTDGEDGPTDAAGGFADPMVIAAIERLALDVPKAMARCDAYPLLAAAGGLIRTGPTGTNVADIRIVLARP